MNSFNKIVLFFLLFVLSISCKKESSNSPGCDVNGLWLGTWNSPGNASGTFFAPVNQDNTALTGNVYIRFDLPSLENHGVDFSGKIIDKNVKSIFDISRVDISVSGTVDNDTAVSGNFNVSIGMSGTYNGTKIPASTPVMNEIYSSGTDLTNIVCIDQTLWICTGRGIYDGWDNFNYVVRRINFNGALIDTLLLPFGGNGMGNRVSFDGQKFWVLDDGAFQIYTFDIQGNKLNTFSSPASYCDALACIDNQVFVTDGYSRVTHVLNQDAEEIKTIPNKYIGISALCKHQGYLFMSTSFYNTILKTDMNGNIIKAYTLPENVLSICSNGTNIWCLTEKYISDPSEPGTLQYKIYEVQLD